MSKQHYFFPAAFVITTSCSLGDVPDYTATTGSTMSGQPGNYGRELQRLKLPLQCAQTTYAGNSHPSSTAGLPPTMSSLPHGVEAAFLTVASSPIAVPLAGPAGDPPLLETASYLLLKVRSRKWIRNFSTNSFSKHWSTNLPCSGDPNFLKRGQNNSNCQVIFIWTFENTSAETRRLHQSLSFFSSSSKDVRQLCNSILSRLPIGKKHGDTTVCNQCTSCLIPGFMQGIRMCGHFKLRNEGQPTTST